MSDFFFQNEGTCHIYVFLQTLLHPLLYQVNLHSESVLIHLPPSSSTSTSPFWAICTCRSSLVTGLVNAEFSGCALLRSNPQVICQTRKRYMITLNPEPIQFKCLENLNSAAPRQISFLVQFPWSSAWARNPRRPLLHVS